MRCIDVTALVTVTNSKWTVDATLPTYMTTGDPGGLALCGGSVTQKRIRAIPNGDNNEPNSWRPRLYVFYFSQCRRRMNSAPQIKQKKRRNMPLISPWNKSEEPLVYRLETVFNWLFIVSYRFNFLRIKVLPHIVAYRLRAIMKRNILYYA